MCQGAAVLAPGREGKQTPPFIGHEGRGWSLLPRVLLTFSFLCCCRKQEVM